MVLNTQHIVTHLNSLQAYESGIIIPIFAGEKIEAQKVK